MLRKMNDWMLEAYVSKTEDIKEHIRRHLKNQRGAGAVEYGLIIAVVVVMVIAVAMTMEGPLKGFFAKVVTTVTNVIKK
jgi:Flp pilus assembly pilin Flp